MNGGSLSRRWLFTRRTSFSVIIRRFTLPSILAPYHVVFKITRDFEKSKLSATVRPSLPCYPGKACLPRGENRPCAATFSHSLREYQRRVVHRPCAWICPAATIRKNVLRLHPKTSQASRQFSLSFIASYLPNLPASREPRSFSPCRTGTERLSLFSSGRLSCRTLRMCARAWIMVSQSQ